MKAFYDKQASIKLIVDVFYIINEVKLSIYRFLTSNTKKCSNRLFPIDLIPFTLNTFLPMELNLMDFSFLPWK